MLKLFYKLIKSFPILSTLIIINIVFSHLSCVSRDNRDPILGKFEDRFSNLIKEKIAFMPASYAIGQIPEGEYAFLGNGYYSEELNGEIIYNKNFDSFGYVWYHGIGNLTTRGVLIKSEFISETGYNNLKSLYEVITSQENYNFSGHYKVGSDIMPGLYYIESVGSGYMSINSGPVGKSEIIENDNFNGSKTIRLYVGEYLELSRCKINNAN